MELRSNKIYDIPGGRRGDGNKTFARLFGIENGTWTAVYEKAERKSSLGSTTWYERRSYQILREGGPTIEPNNLPSGRIFTYRTWRTLRRDLYGATLREGDIEGEEEDEEGGYAGGEEDVRRRLYF